MNHLKPLYCLSLKEKFNPTLFFKQTFKRVPLSME